MLVSLPTVLLAPTAIAQDEHWSGSLLDELKHIPAGQFEAVDGSSLMFDPNSATARA